MACMNKKFDECLNIKDDASVPKRPEFEALYTASPVDSLIIKEDAEKKILALRYILEKDLRAADLKWSLFVAACHTYRTDTCLRPFPPMYIKNDTKDIDSLRRVVERMPPLPIIAQELKDLNIYKNKPALVELLYWVLLKLGDLHIKNISKDCHESVLKRVNYEVAVAAPNLIFQVASAKQSATEERWRELAKGRSTFFAFHGSRLENFHSILHYGLQQHMCKKALFGEGIYLSNELAVSLPYSPVGYGWGGSILGSDMSCVALCEIINHPEVKIGTEDNSSRNITIESTGSKVPNKYCLVTNSDLVRIRYLLVYSQEFGRLRSTRNSGVLGWLRQHKLLTFMLGYVVLLASVGLSHNRNVERYLRLLMRRFGLD